MIFILLFPLISNAKEKGLDETINDAIMPLATWSENLVLFSIPILGFDIPIILIILVLGALFFTIYFGFINIRHFLTAIQVVRGKHDHVEHNSPALTTPVDDVETSSSEGNTDSNNGEVNHFQALTTAVSGTVGLGNIALVAVAISIGGPGATFWMILAGLIGMSTKFVECTLGVKYRDIDKHGNVHGGPMYYLYRGLKDIGYKKFGKFLGILFAIFCVGASFGGGNAFQTNQATSQILAQFNIQGSSSGTILGIIFGILVGIVIIGGIKRIAKVTEKVVPFMAGIYIVVILIILFSNFFYIDDAIRLIFKEAFSPRATVTGGAVGVMIQGFRRAAFSNEAGSGSAAIAHSAVNTKFAASEGLVALLEPFIDTVIICSLTAITIVMFNMDGAFIYGDVVDGMALMADGSRVGGVNLTSLAFEQAIPGSSYILVIAVTLFAFSTILSWSYYGLQAWKFLFGRSKLSALIFKLIFLTFTILGAAISMDAVLKFSEAMILALVFPNMIGLFILFPKVKEELKRYLTAIKRKKHSNTSN